MHSTLKPQLGELQTAVAPLATGYGELDDQANALLARYNDYVSSDCPHPGKVLGTHLLTNPDVRAQISTLSEIFVSWHEVVSAAEERLTVLEREKAKEATQDIS